MDVLRATTIADLRFIGPVQSVVEQIVSVLLLRTEVLTDSPFIDVRVTSSQSRRSRTENLRVETHVHSSTAWIFGFGI